MWVVIPAFKGDIFYLLSRPYDLRIAKKGRDPIGEFGVSVIAIYNHLYLFIYIFPLLCQGPFLQNDDLPNKETWIFLCGL